MTTTALSRLTASLEDYLEAIFNLSAGEEVARAKDIAIALNVARPSVTGALKILAKKDLVNYRPYGYVTLTPAGMAAARKVARKHDIIKAFFTGVLGVDDTLAHDTACKAEHALGSQIVSRLGEFSDFVSRTENGVDIAEQFRRFRMSNGIGRGAKQHD
jgi:DtxR family transcriptional regulator, Mn-dependent transcriptional regulator